MSSLTGRPAGPPAAARYGSVRAVPMPERDDVRGVGAAIGDAIVAVISRVPETRETPVADPEVRVRELARQAARRAAVVSGGLALPPGPLGVLTLIPDLMAIWRIQAQLVADVAGVRGHSGTLTREQMLYCLFRHAAAQVLRDVVVRAGERAVVHRLTVTAIATIASKLGVHLSSQLLAKTASRWVPGLGAAAVAAYAWWDTERVARVADELFRAEVVLDPDPDAPPAPPVEETPRGRMLREAAGPRGAGPAP